MYVLLILLESIVNIPVSGLKTNYHYTFTEGNRSIGVNVWQGSSTMVRQWTAMFTESQIRGDHLPRLLMPQQMYRRILTHIYLKVKLVLMLSYHGLLLKLGNYPKIEFKMCPMR